jgi:hypothetical protein
MVQNKPSDDYCHSGDGEFLRHDLLLESLNILMMPTVPCLHYKSSDQRWTPLILLNTRTAYFREAKGKRIRLPVSGTTCPRAFRTPAPSSKIRTAVSCSSCREYG